jgi:YgiT-type zinc finger domain-containing protein
MKPAEQKTCPLCGGTRKAGESTFSAELGFGVVIVRHVPASVCSQCGEDWIEDPVAAQVERYVEEARRKHSKIEVVDLRAAS